MFERDTLKQNATVKEQVASKEFCEALCHLMSLLHAVALQNLRRDWDLKNLAIHDSESSQPTMVSGFACSASIPWVGDNCYSSVCINRLMGSICILGNNFSGGCKLRTFLQDER